jgi:WD40 repeat protein
VLILDTESLETVTTIEQSHDGGVGMLDLTSDNMLIATVGLDGFARLWDFSSGSLVAEIPVDTDDQVRNVQFTGGDRQLMVVGTHGLVKIIAVDNGDLLKVARSRLTRTFTERECSNYSIDPCPTFEEMTSG